MKVEPQKLEAFSAQVPQTSLGGVCAKQSFTRANRLVRVFCDVLPSVLAAIFDASTNASNT